MFGKQAGFRAVSLNVVDVDAFLMSQESSFQSRGGATQNARSPSFSPVRGTTRSPLEADRSWIRRLSLETDCLINEQLTAYMAEVLRAERQWRQSDLLCNGTQWQRRIMEIGMCGERSKNWCSPTTLVSCYHEILVLLPEDLLWDEVGCVSMCVLCSGVHGDAVWPSLGGHFHDGFQLSSLCTPGVRCGAEQLRQQARLWIAQLRSQSQRLKSRDSLETPRRLIKVDIYVLSRFREADISASLWSLPFTLRA